MKKVIFLTCLLTLIGCTCLPQIPPQTVYIDENCEATLPDYKLQVTVRDNCEGVLLYQDPLPGTILTFADPHIRVHLTAVDAAGLQDTMSFEVYLIDDIPPEIIPDSSLLLVTWEERFDYLDTFLSLLQGQVPDSTLKNKNLSMVFYASGGYVGVWQDSNRYITPLTLSDIGGIRQNKLIDAGVGDDAWLTQSEGGVWTNDTATFIGYPFKMLNSERFGNFSYSIPASNGWYKIDLFFAEIYWTKEGQRVFDVELEGDKVLDDFDIIKEAGVPMRGVNKGWVIDIQDGHLDLNFTSEVDYAKLSAIRIEQITYQTASL